VRPADAGTERRRAAGCAHRRVVAGALRAAASFFDIHYKSIRAFRGGRIR